jgi:hypothetical protein
MRLPGHRREGGSDIADVGLDVGGGGSGGVEWPAYARAISTSAAGREAAARLRDFYLDWIFWTYLATIELTNRVLDEENGTNESKVALR